MVRIFKVFEKNMEKYIEEEIGEVIPIRLKRVRLFYYFLEKHVEKLKNIILKHKFKNQNEEIKFFKETNKTCSSMQDVFEFHLQCLLDLKNEK